MVGLGDKLAPFLTTYPALGDANRDFANRIYHLKEFYDFRMEGADPKQALHGPTLCEKTLTNQQVIVSRFMSSLTPYRSLLLLHEPGTGKTLASFAIAESLSVGSPKKVFFVAPNEGILVDRREEIRGCHPTAKFVFQKVSTLSKQIGRIAKRAAGKAEAPGSG